MYQVDTTLIRPRADMSSPGHLTADTVQLRPTLLGMASAYPPFEVTMQDSWELLFQHMSPQVRFGRRIVESTAVRKRHIIWSPAMLRDACGMQTGDRMAAHADAVMDVAARSISQAIGDVDKDPRRQLCDGLLDRIRQSRPRSPVSGKAWAAFGSAAHVHRPHGLLCGAERHQGGHGQRRREA